MKQSFILVLGLLALGACSASDPAAPAAPISASAPAAFVINTHGNADVAVSHEAMDVLTEPASRAVLSSRSTLADAEAGALAALAAAPDLSAAASSELRQMVASTMIQRHLAQPSPDMSAVGRYTETLVAEDSPNAHLIADALVALKPTWGEARTHAAATKTATVAADYLEETCPGCLSSARRGAAVGTVEAPDPSESHRMIQSGINALEAI